MAQLATQSTRLTTGRASDVLMGRISSRDGPTPIQRLFQHERWEPAHDIRHSMDIGVVGIGGRLLDLVKLARISGLPHTIADLLIEGPLLLKNLQEALAMTKRCEDVCEDFEKHWPAEMIREWKEMKRRWEVDPTQPDPYVVVEKGKMVIHVTPLILTP